jgi:hypothetical protein
MSVPPGFKPSTLGLKHLDAMVEAPVEELITALAKNAHLCDQVMNQSGDKRYTPSTFIQQAGGTFRVGWFDNEYRAVRTFSRREWAVADYLLFSFGKGRLRT